MDNNLRSIVDRQRETLTELENEVKSIENSDLSKENEELKAELEKLNAAHLKSEQNALSLSEQNVGLKNALYEQVYNEKVKIVNSTKEKLDIYFKGTVENEENRLAMLENSIQVRINNMVSILRQNNVDIKDEIYQRFNELSEQVNFKVTEARQKFAQSHGAFSENERAEFEELKNEQITDEQVLAVTKKNNAERFLGLNILNYIGILLIIIGTIATAQLPSLHDFARGLIMFALGGVMLVAGEMLNRKRANVFSLGLTAGGVGVLYAATAISHFQLEILSTYPALILCALIATGAFVLSTRYNSQTIAVFALIGGYLPMFSMTGNVYGAMIYFVALNLLALTVSFRKKWNIASFIGLFLNIVGTIYICTKFNYNSGMADKVIAVLYVLFAFLIYTLIPIVSTYISKLKFRKRDVVLLAINTFVSSYIMYVMFYTFEWQDFTGTLAIAFALIYLSLGWLIEHKFDGEKNTQVLFYLTGLAFVVLVIPFQFGRSWLTLGWLAEGVALTAYGILKDIKAFKKYGFIINALCLASFLIFDLMMGINSWFWYDLFAYKYLAVTLGSLIILGSYMYKRRLSSGWQKFYKCAVIVNLWFYVIYICGKLENLDFINYHTRDYLIGALSIALTLLIAYIAPRIKILSDTPVKIISIILYIIGILWLIFIQNNATPYYGETSWTVKLISHSVLIILSLLSVFAVHDLMKLIVMERKLGVEWYPLIVSAYFVTILTQNLITQYHLSFASAWISIIYVLTALAWIILGFAKRYSFIRKFGLGLALLAVVKLFIVDIGSLTQSSKILSYFALGITLIAISFVYQYFNKRLELKMEVPDNASENL